MTQFKLTDETKEYLGITLCRVELTEDHPVHGKAGTKGGWVVGEHCINGDAWVYGEAKVYGDAKVYGNAKVYGYAEVSGNAIVSGNAKVYEYAEVSGNAIVYGNAEVYGKAKVSGNAVVSGNAIVYGYAKVFGNAIVYGNAEVSGHTKVSKNVHTSNYIYDLTLSDNHINYGCVIRTIEEWKQFLESDEVIRTPRNDPKFKIIRMALELAIAQHEYDKSENRKVNTKK